jgi:hypothetical protein
MVIKIIQETAHPVHAPRFGFMLFDLDEKDEIHHLVMEVAFEQLAEQLLFRHKMMFPQAMDCRPAHFLACSFFAIAYF